MTQTTELAPPRDAATRRRDSSAAGLNLERSRTARLALGHTRDVVTVEGTVQVLPMDALPAEVGDRFARRAGFDTREDEGYAWFRITPRRIHAWREVNELGGREILRDGRWLG